MSSSYLLSSWENQAIIIWSPYCLEQLNKHNTNIVKYNRLCAFVNSEPWKHTFTPPKTNLPNNIATIWFARKNQIVGVLLNIKWDFKNATVNMQCKQELSLLLNPLTISEFLNFWGVRAFFCSMGECGAKFKKVLMGPYYCLLSWTFTWK